MPLANHNIHLWFSSSTYLGTLLALQSEFGSQAARKSRKGKIALYLRLFFMLFTITLLITALIPTGYSTWLSLPGVSARCYYPPDVCSWPSNVPMDMLCVSPGILGYNVASSSLSTLILIARYTWRVLSLFNRPLSLVQAYVVDGPSKWALEGMNNMNRQQWWKIWRHAASDILLIMVTVVRAVKVMALSFLWEVRIDQIS